MEIMDVVNAAAKRNGLHKITDILLALGPFSVLVMLQLNFYFDEARLGTIMSEAVLRMEQNDALTGIRQMYVKSIAGD